MANAGDTENNRATIAAVILFPRHALIVPLSMRSGYNIARQRQMLLLLRTRYSMLLR